MDLLLELRCWNGQAITSTDVVVDIDPDDTVEALTHALCAYANRHSPAPLPDDVVVVRGTASSPARPTDPPLHPAARIVDSGLVSGDTVLLTPPRPPVPPDPDLGLSLDVAAGPQAGRSVRLTPGRHTVGGGVGCKVVIADPLLSREQFTLEVTAQGGLRVVPSPGATTGTRVGGALVEEPTFVEPGEEIQAGATVLVARRLAPDATRRRDRLGQVPFNRVPYRRAVVPTNELDELPAPPTTPDRKGVSLLQTLLPALSGLGFAFMMNNRWFLALMLATPLLFVVKHFTDKRGGRKKFLKDRAAFFDRVEARAAEIDRLLDQERRIRLTAAPDLADLGHQAAFHMPRLWERDRFAGDLLELRLGLGDLPSQITQRIQRGGDPDLLAAGEAMLAHHTTVLDVPVTVNVVEAGTVGFCGEPGHVAAVGRAVVVQAACLHSPEDLVVAAAVGELNVNGHDWLKWLPHVRSATSPLDGDHIVVGPAGTRKLLANLLAVANLRAERQRGFATADAGLVWPRLLVVMDETADPDRALLSQLLDIGPALGIHVLWLGRSELQVPRQCRAVLHCPGVGQPGVLRSTDPSVADRTVELDGTGPVVARTIARALAPLRDASAGTATTAIPRVVPLLDVLDLERPDGEVIAARWSQPRPYGLELAIGQSVEGPFTLDLVEQGPHSLIGGTSGAGKSELLQTLVLSLAANYSPARLNFLFVDYKGGASSAEFRDLPHTVGYVTNLSGRLALRALTSLRAELRRRMELMEGRAKDLTEMLEVAPEEAPASLVIVVDEFAALVKEIPDFVAGMVDVAQRGRSLGIHLVLATQRPTGVVNENILANTNLRIALRMLDPSDSDNIINSRVAADIPVPLRGRAYARTGPQTLVPFQTAWSGAPYVAHGGEEQKVVDVHPCVLAPHLAPEMSVAVETGAVLADRAATTPAGAAAPAPGSLTADAETHLDVLVAACIDAHRRLGLPPARRPWVEPLAEVIPVGDVLAEIRPTDLTRDPGRYAVIGRYDDPDSQAQRPALVDLEASGGLIVYGTGGSGKTTLLRTLALGMTAQGDADSVVVYALDYASRSLDPLAELPHCAAVLQGDDEEGVTRLLTLLDREVDTRRRLLAEHRSESLGALRERSGELHVPRIVVLLDSYGNFYDTFDKSDRYVWQQLFQQIVTAGRQVGIHCVLTHDRRMGIGPALQSAVAARLVLRMSSPDEMTALNVPTKVAKDADLPPGRGFASWMGGGGTEVQVALPGEDPAGAAQAEHVLLQAEKLRVASPARAPELPELPERFRLDDLDAVSGGRGGGLVGERMTATLGLHDLTLTPLAVDLRRQNFVVLGPPMSGRSSTLATVATGLRASTGDDLRMVVIGSASSPLQALDVWDDAAFSRAAQQRVAEALWESVADDEGVDARAVLFVDGPEDIDDYDVERPLEQLVKRECVRLVVACEPVTLTKAYSGWLSTLRRNRSALFLQPETRTDVESALEVRPALRPGQAFPPGRGIFAANRAWSLVQVGLASDAPPRSAAS
ncbi:MAG TPA: FtsK/SpoIIIE domain-containing protein [Acidimicrobiales bacterium]